MIGMANVSDVVVGKSAKSPSSKEGSGFSQVLNDVGGDKASKGGAEGSAAKKASTETLAKSDGNSDVPVRPGADADGAASDVGIVIDDLDLSAAAETTPSDLSPAKPKAPKIPAVASPLGALGAGALNEDVLAQAVDLKSIVSALKKQSEGDVVPTDTPVVADDASDEFVTTDAIDDMLSLLQNVTAIPVNATKDGSLAVKKGDGNAIGMSLNKTAGSTTTTADTVLSDQDVDASNIFKLQKADGASSSVEMHLSTDAEGALQIDVGANEGNASDVVQIVESRRFVGLTPSSNASVLTSAILADSDWATAMEAGVNLANAGSITSTGQVVHTLKIQMNPLDLGQVEANLKLIGDDLSVHLTVSNAKAYHELANDSSAILDALRGQGFSVDQVTVSMSTSADKQDLASSGGRQQAGPGQQGNEAGGNARQDDQARQQAHSGTISGDRNESIVETVGQSSSRAGRPEQVYL